MNNLRRASIYTSRLTHDYHVIDLPFDKKDIDTQLIDLGALRIYFKTGSKCLDIGSLMYTDRKASLKSKRGLSKKYISYEFFEVNIDTYKKSRKEPLERFIENIFIQAKKGISFRTLDSKIRMAMKFMIWCDASRLESCLDDEIHAKRAFKQYIKTLDHKNKIYDPIKKLGLSNSSATAYQNYVRDFLSVALNIQMDVLMDGLRLFRKKRHDFIPTLAPTHETLGRNLALWSSLFYKITDFLLKEKQYPFEMLLPEGSLWLLPHRPPFVLSRTNTKPIWFDSFKGRLLKYHEIKAIYGSNSAAANRSIKYAKNTLNTANDDSRSKYRYRLGKIAHDAFFMMFMLYTRTRTEVRHIKWTDNTKIINAHTVGFKIIKARAKGKACEYQVAKLFTKELKRYLKLRKWLLNNQSFEYLFLRLDQKGKANKTPLDTPSQFNRTVILKLINPKFPIITPSECRLAGADYFINKYDIATAADMLQNQQSTLKKHYANGNHQRASQQLTNFFQKLRQQVVRVEDKNSDQIEVPSGHCANFDMPIPEIDSPIIVNCNIPQGCLYCENYAVHADETDVRKLISLEYLIKETKVLAHSIEHFEAIYGGLLKRISELFKELNELDESTEFLVKKIHKEVYQEEKLSYFWDNKLRQLVNMGVL